MENFDTICALATPNSTSALAIIRISGDSSHSIINKIVKAPNKFKNAEKNKIYLYKIKNNKNEIIDEVTIIKYLSPKSFTGENMVEIICHGGKIVIEKILKILIDNGSRFAKKGEFTRRAFSNGKTNLLKAESINQIIHSKTDDQQSAAINDYLGNYNEKIIHIKKQTEDILIKIESQIEFGENDDIIEEKNRNEIKKEIEILEKEIKKELEKRSKIENVEKGLNIAITGPVNAGKSTLMNLILGYERSIVDKEKGTTRDFIGEKVLIDSTPVNLIDTAGLTKTNNKIENRGIIKTKEFIHNAHILIWVTSANEKIYKYEKEIEDGNKIIGIINKIDLNKGKEKEEFFKKNNIPYIKTSVNNEEKKKEIERFINKEIKEIYNDVQYDSIIANTRQKKTIEKIFDKIKSIKLNIKDEEIIALYCREILDNIEEFVGTKTSEDILNNIFDQFCVGK